MIFQDKQVVRRIRLGDKDALASLYHIHKQDLYLFAYAMLRDGHLAEDVVHDTFVSFVNNVRTLDLKSSLKSYLATSAANRARDILRKRKFNPADIESCPEPASQDNPASQAEHKDLSDKLIGGLASLPPEQSEAILLRIRNNMSFRQIAEDLKGSGGFKGVRHFIWATAGCFHGFSCFLGRPAGHRRLQNHPLVIIVIPCCRVGCRIHLFNPSTESIVLERRLERIGAGIINAIWIGVKINMNQPIFVVVVVRIPGFAPLLLPVLQGASWQKIPSFPNYEL